MGVDDGGNGVVPDAVFAAEHVIHRRDSFAGGHVGQHAAPRDVAAGPYARNVGLAAVRSANAFGAEIDSGFFQPQPCDIGRAAGSVEHAVGGIGALRTVPFHVV